MNTVLVVDDEPAIRNLESRILKSAGYRVLTAANGQEALDIVRHTSPAIIVLDLQMPVMDGAAFFEELVREPERPSVLIVASNDALRTQRKLGAEASLAKPFTPEDLLDRVSEMKRREALSES